MRLRYALTLTFLALAQVRCPIYAAAPEDSAIVVAQELTKLRAATGDISAVTWTRRKDYYTLQIVGPAPSSVVMPGMTSTQPGSEKPIGPAPAMAVSVLRADGSPILPMRRWQTTTPTADRPCIRCSAPEVLFSFPLSVAPEAVTATIAVGTRVYTERLMPLDK